MKSILHPVRLLLLCGFALFAGACTSEYKAGTVLKETVYRAEPYTITEEILYDYGDFFDDDYYQRVYVVETESKEVVSFAGPSTMWSIEMPLAESPPKKVGDWLAVFSIDQVWLWQPGQSVIAFEPVRSLEENVWQDNQMEKPLNAADYWATDFRIEADQWILEYTDVLLTEKEKMQPPQKYYFISQDKGKTFVPQATLDL